ncbi:hypothetical protein GCM10008982_01210 [Anoxybacillus voinovskiensis]|nr:hypothetical protein GCM10008982_01210 [Anoxybacillus voinovskiensis]
MTYFDGVNTHTFTYDFANRLKSWAYQGNTVQYDYDAAGNLKNPHGKTLTFNAANEVEGFTYDEAGNLLQDDRYQYTWDGEGRMLLNDHTIFVIFSSIHREGSYVHPPFIRLGR